MAEYNIIIECDRCHKLVNGCISGYLTGGFYDVTSPPWDQFQRWEEEKICDECMFSDKKYQKLYGIRAEK
jgi:hypothetical protein